MHHTGSSGFFDKTTKIWYNIGTSRRGTLSDRKISDWLKKLMVTLGYALVPGWFVLGFGAMFRLGGIGGPFADDAEVTLMLAFVGACIMGATVLWTIWGYRLLSQTTRMVIGGLWLVLTVASGVLGVSGITPASKVEWALVMLGFCYGAVIILIERLPTEA